MEYLEGKFEIHQGLCTRFELHEIILHCLMVVHKIDGQVGDHKNKKLQSYKQVMPQTLSLPLVAVWEQVVTEYNKENPDEDESLGTFGKILKKFFACHSTEDNRHELASVIRYAIKPETMKVQPFFYRLKELNECVNWLPGDEPALTDVQLNLAFYNSMPGHWRVQHAISGQSAHATSRAELLHYFRVQEHEKISVAYNSAARFKSKIKAKAHQKGQAHVAIKAKPAGSTNGHHAGYLKNKKTGGKIGGKSVSQTDKCPIHPDGKHKWGDCFQNILNKKPPAKGSFSKKGKSATTTHEVNLMDIDPPSEEAINDIDLSRDECIVLDVSGSNFPDTSNECKECNLDGKSNTFATLTSAKAMMTAQKGKSFDSYSLLISRIITVRF
jgi:hypothetical protein